MPSQPGDRQNPPYVASRSFQPRHLWCDEKNGTGKPFAIPLSLQHSRILGSRGEKHQAFPVCGRASLGEPPTPKASSRWAPPWIRRRRGHRLLTARERPLRAVVGFGPSPLTVDGQCRLRPNFEPGGLNGRSPRRQARNRAISLRSPRLAHWDPCQAATRIWSTLAPWAAASRFDSKDV